MNHHFNFEVTAVIILHVAPQLALANLTTNCAKCISTHCSSIQCANQSTRADGKLQMENH